MRIRLIILLTACATFLGAQGFTDGFMEGKGNGTLAITGSYEAADTYFFGDLRQPTDYTVRSLAAYLAYGINDQFDLVASIPYMQTDSLNRGLQDAIFSLKYQNGKRELTHGRLRTITMIGFQFPLSDYPTRTARPIGVKAASFLFRILTQYEGYNGFFAHFQTGFDFRVLPEQLFGMPFIVRAGYGNNTFYFDLWLDYFHSFDQSADQTIFAGSGPRWWKTGGTFYVPIGKQFGAFVGGAYILSGRNIAQSWRVNLGGVWNF